MTIVRMESIEAQAFTAENHTAHQYLCDIQCRGTYTVEFVELMVDFCHHFLVIRYSLLTVND